MNRKEVLEITLAFVFIDMAVSYLFFDSLYAFFLLIFAFPVYIRLIKKEKLQKQKEQLEGEFKEGIRLAAGALQAGYSMERALKSAEKELMKLYGQETLMKKELHTINARIALNEPMELALQEFADRSGIEEVESFAQIFCFAKREGGDFVNIIYTTVERISERIEVMQEIKTAVAAKQFEQNIMSIVPLCMLLYLRIGSPGFLDGLYHNVQGILFMGISLIIYVAAFMAGRKIVKIRI